MKKLLRGLLVMAFWLLCWQGVAMLVGKTVLLPPPLSVLKALLTLAGTWEFWFSAANSVLRVLEGLLLGVLAGVLTAAGTARFPALQSLLSPVMSAIKATPIASFIILALVWFRVSFIPVFTAFLIVYPLVWANVEQGIRSTDPALLEMAHAFRMPRKNLLTKIYVPSIKPYFLAAFNSGMGMAWKAGIAAEVICSARTSIGGALHDAKIYLETENLFAWTYAVILLSILLEKLFFRLAAWEGRRRDA